MASLVPVSVIVPTRNSGATISACLRSILDVLPADGSEVVVVDGQSSDDTVRLVRDLAVTLVQVPPCFVAHSRNVGVARARHALVLFVDSDCTVDDGWYRAIQETLAAPDIGIVGSRYSLRPTPSWVERAWDRAHRRSPMPEVADVVYVPGGNLAMRREVFDLVGGFDERVETGEDMDLCTRVKASGHRVVDHVGMTCAHLGEPRTLAAVYRRNRWHGRGTRLRYSDGRLAPILLSTVVFAGTVVAAAWAMVLALFEGPSLLTPLVLSPTLMPAVYAARYARPPRLVHGAQLVAVYGAYFLGRARALPAVAGRIMRERAAGKL